MKNIAFKQKFEINGRKIAVTVIGDQKSLQTQPFTLFLPGGPGVPSEYFIPKIKQMIEAGKQNSAPITNFILFDPLGTGESDDAQDQDTEYTVENFTEIAAQVVEKTMAAMKLKSMDLQLYGQSFGTTTAISMLMARPEWTTDSPIKLKQIVVESFFDGMGSFAHLSELFEENYRKHRNYQRMKHWLYKDIKNEVYTKEDVLQANFAYAPFYSDASAKKLNSFAGKLLQFAPRFFVGVFNIVNKILHSDEITAIVAALDKFNVKQQYHFQKNRYGNFSASRLVNEHRELYSKVPVCFINGEHDIITPHKYGADLIQPNFSNMASIIFNAKHDIPEDRPEDFQVLSDVLFSRSIDVAKLTKLQTTSKNKTAAICSYQVPEQYLNLLQEKNVAGKQEDTTPKVYRDLNLKREYQAAPQEPVRETVTATSETQPLLQHEEVFRYSAGMKKSS